MTFDDSAFATLERTLGRVMLAGVMSSAVFLAVGVALFLTGYEGAALTTTLTVGLMLLMATPVLRVLVAVIEATRMRDWFFLLTTLAVVMLLATTVMLTARMR